MWKTAKIAETAGRVSRKWVTCRDGQWAYQEPRGWVVDQAWIRGYKGDG